MRPTHLMIRAGLLLGALRAVWMAAEHLIGARTTHLEWVEPSYGLFLFVGTPLVWAWFLLANRTPWGLRDLLVMGVGAGVISGAIHVGLFSLYTEWLNPEYLDEFIQWNAANSSNTFDVADREFRLPAFLDILMVHPILFNPIVAVVVHTVLRKRLRA